MIRRDPAMLRRIRELLAAGHSARLVAAHLGLRSRHVVRGIAVSYGLLPNLKHDSSFRSPMPIVTGRRFVADAYFPTELRFWIEASDWSAAG